MSSPIDPGSRGTSTFHVNAGQPQSRQSPEGKTRRSNRVQAVEVASTEGLKPRHLPTAPLRTKLGARMGISLARPFAKFSGLFRGGQLPANFQSDLKTAIDGSNGQLFRQTVAKMAPFGHDKLYQESLSGEVTLHEPLNLTAGSRNERMHQQWMDCRMEGKPPLFYLAKRGNYSMVENICRNPGIGLSSLELEPVVGSRPRVIPGDLNKKGLAGYGGSPFAFALDNGNRDTALAMAANGGSLQYGGAKEVFTALNLTPDDRSEFRNAFTAREGDIQNQLSTMVNKKAQLEKGLQEMREQYGQLISWESPNFANFDDYPEPELSDDEWAEIKQEFMALKKEASSLVNPIRLLQAQSENVKADLKLVKI